MRLLGCWGIFSVLSLASIWIRLSSLYGIGESTVNFVTASSRPASIRAICLSV